MKLSLVVAQGVHAGKVIPVTSAEFVIGRDPQCQLRPASPAISKQHCAVTTRDGKAFVRDCGSTNGTFINGEQVAGERRDQVGGPAQGRATGVRPADRRAAPTPAPPAAARPAAAKPGSKPAVAATDTVPSGATMILEPPAAGKPANTTVVEGSPGTPNDDPDHLAAMLLGLDEPAGSGPTVESMSADPTTVMEMPALGTKPGEPKKDEPKKGHGDSASAAAEVLSKYMRRPRT